MSFTENDRKIRSESRKTFPNGDAPDAGQSFQALISRALQREFGDTPASVKTVAKLVNANERAVRNWFDGRNGPSGEHLMVLMRHSGLVLETVLALSGHRDLTAMLLVSQARDRVREVLSALDAIAEAAAVAEHSD